MILTIFKSVKGRNVPRKEYDLSSFDQLQKFIAGVSAQPNLTSKDLVKLGLPGVVFGQMKGDRNDENTVNRTAVCFDYDGENKNNAYQSNKSPEWAAQELRDQNICFFMYTTPTDCCEYDEKTKTIVATTQRKWRVVCPLSKPVSPDDAELLTGRLYRILEGRSDDCVFKKSQAYFIGKLTGQKDIEFWHNESGLHIDECDHIAPLYANGTATPDLQFQRCDKDFLITRMTDDQLTEAMAQAQNGDAVDWEAWNKLGMNLYNASGGGQHGFNLFKEFSQQSKNYDFEAVKERWQNYRKSPPKYLDGRNLQYTVKAVAETASVAEKAEVYENKKYNILPASHDGGDPPHDFVEDLLHVGGFSIVYGGSNVGKTFWCLALAQAIASGEQFLEQKDCDQGSVLYIAAEGGGSIWNRIKAMGIDGQNTDNLYILAAPIDLFDVNADTAPLSKEIVALTEQMTAPLSLIVFDTMQKIAPGLNENDSGDTGVLMSNLDRIRDAMPNPVARMLVHHTGKDATKGMRGSSALFAAADTVVELKKVGDGYGVATATKQRDLDASTFTDVGYRLETIPLGVNKRGKPFGSCVVRPCEMNKQKTATKLNDGERRLYDIVNDVFSNPGRPVRPQKWTKSGGQIRVKNAVHKTEVFEWFRTGADTPGQNPDTIRKAFSRAINGLQNKGLLVFHDDFLGQPDNAGQLSDNF